MRPDPLTAILFASAIGAAPLAHAGGGIPVIDVTAITHLIKQVNYWQQQIQGMTNQLNQLHAQYTAITGSRGMEKVAPMTNLARNYLPPDYVELMHTVNNASVTYAGLSTEIQTAMAANAVLTTADLNRLTPDQRKIVEDGRKAAGMAQALSQSAYRNTSQRFAALQQLVTAIGAANDLKAIQDLQGRVGAEQAMLENEQTKLQLLAQMAQADQSAQHQRIREQVMAGHGDVSTRFTPKP